MLGDHAGKIARFLIIARRSAKVFGLGLVLGSPRVAAGLGNAGSWANFLSWPESIGLWADDTPIGELAWEGE